MDCIPFIIQERPELREEVFDEKSEQKRFSTVTLKASSDSSELIKVGKQ